MSRIPVTNEPLTVEQKTGLEFQIPYVPPVIRQYRDKELVRGTVEMRPAGATFVPDPARPFGAKAEGTLRPGGDENNAMDFVKPTDEGDESILQEAHRLTHGPRNKDYGHPLDDYTRTAALASALLADKLKEPITAEEMALVMCCVKLSRHVHAPKRDNMTDLAGYAWVSWACTEERARRNPLLSVSTKESTAL